MAKYYCGDGIRHYRKIADIKQESLAQAVQLRRQTISDIERNKTKVDDGLLEQIAKELGAAPENIKQYKNGMVARPDDPLTDLGHRHNTGLAPVAVFEAFQQLLKVYQEALQQAHIRIDDLNNKLTRREGDNG